jgi:hypothetical protein
VDKNEVIVVSAADYLWGTWPPSVLEREVRGRAERAEAQVAAIRALAERWDRELRLEFRFACDDVALTHRHSREVRAMLDKQAGVGGGPDPRATGAS